MTVDLVLSGELRWHVEHGDSLAVLKSMPDACVDAVITDPPAGIGFMGKEWDDFRRSRNPNDVARADVFGRTSARAPELGRRDCEKFIAFLSEILSECYRVTKPGGRMLCWSIPRTMHWTGAAIEGAGWEIENVIAHLFGSGFPKARSQLKPAFEGWWLARKLAKNVLPLNIDECRVATSDNLNGGAYAQNGTERYDGTENCRFKRTGRSTLPGDDREGASLGMLAPGHTTGREFMQPSGRWPANVVLSGDAIAELDRQSGTRRSGTYEAMGYAGNGRKPLPEVIGDSGGASRFFNHVEPDADDIVTAQFVYAAKAARSDRGEANRHPTVKGTPLMRHLVKLIAKPGAVVLDAFCGSGSTGRGAVLEGCRFIGIEREDTEAEPYVTIARRRIAEAEGSTPTPQRERQESLSL